MNQYGWKTEPVPGGYKAFIRRVDRSGYDPVREKDGNPGVWSTLMEAEHAAMSLLFSFINTDMRRCGDKLEANKSVADRYFKKLVKQRGKSKTIPVERR